MITDTIAAPATGDNKSAIGIIRISGPESWDIVDKVFFPSGRDKPRFMVLGRLYDPKSSKLIDICQAVYYKAPKSYTGEDMVEIFCHGGSFHIREVFRVILLAGARQAKPGEFTRRAVLNGKMSLSQAESIMDIINAENEIIRQAALKKLEGNLTEYLDNIIASFESIIVKIEASLQYPEEMEVFISYDNLYNEVISLYENIMTALQKSKRLSSLFSGFSVVLVGKTNAGKSSIFNKLVGYERVIVSKERATTRDAVPERITFEDGLSFILWDTAGFGKEGGGVDEHARKITWQKIISSDLVLFIIDNSEIFDKDDFDLLEEIKKIAKDIIFVINKIDLGEKNVLPLQNVKKISALTGEGLDLLLKEVHLKVKNKVLIAEEGFLLSDIVYNGLFQVSKIIENILQNLKNREFLDIINENLRLAVSIVSDIAGRNLTDTILDRIFERFCLGK